MSEPIRCTNCPAHTRSSLDVARALGWRVWDGESVTGKSLTVRICPQCAGGHAGDEKPPPAGSWRVGCDTCDWEWEDEYDEGPLTEKDARRLADDHECEPSTWVKPPMTPEELAREVRLFERSRRALVTVEVPGVSR